MKVNTGKVNQGEVSVEWNNGESFNFSQHVRDLLSTQDIAAWQNNPDGFNIWLSANMAQTMKDLRWSVRPTLNP